MDITSLYAIRFVTRYLNAAHHYHQHGSCANVSEVGEKNPTTLCSIPKFVVDIGEIRKYRKRYSFLNGVKAIWCPQNGGLKKPAGAHFSFWD
jgi:hypothetical protein